MKIIPTNYSVMVLLCVFFSVLFSCNKDSDLFVDAVLSEPIIALENRYPDISADEVGYVIRTFAFSPKSDAYLQDEQGLNQSIVRLQEDFRTSYLKFDLSEINGEITGAVLKFSIDSDEGDGKITIYKGDSNAWSEDNLSVDNAPKSLEEIASINNNYKVGAPIKIDLDFSSFSPEQTTLIMTHSEGNDLAFASKESTTNNGPKLIISYKVLEDSPLIEIEEGQEQFDQPKNPVDPGAYYVTTNGKSTNDGRTEATSWNIEHAFDKAIAGDVVYVKAGNYGNVELIVDNSGTLGNLIKFIGYTNTPGDLVASEGSTFKYGESLNSDKLPLLVSAQMAKGTGISISENYVEIENFQVSKYRIGATVNGNNVVVKNLIATELGTQTNYDSYDGFGIIVHGNNVLIENCFVLNAAAEAIKLFGSLNSIVNYCTVHADNPTNPTDYYYLLTGGTNNSTINNSLAKRNPSLSHGGHGFDMKDLAENNIFRNCTAINTSFELNFSGVRYNSILDCSIYGIDTDSSNWHARMSIYNGANNNHIKNMSIQNTWTAIDWGDYEDGYVGPGGDRDEISSGYDNTFEEITVKNTRQILNVGGGTTYEATASRNTFLNCEFSNFDLVASTYFRTKDILFKNCSFSNGNRFVEEGQGEYAPYSHFDVTWENCTWSNVNFTPPN